MGQHRREFRSKPIGSGQILPEIRPTRTPVASEPPVGLQKKLTTDPPKASNLCCTPRPHPLFCSVTASGSRGRIAGRELRLPSAEGAKGCSEHHMRPWRRLTPHRSSSTLRRGPRLRARQSHCCVFLVRCQALMPQELQGTDNSTKEVPLACHHSWRYARCTHQAVGSIANLRKGAAEARGAALAVLDRQAPK